jgi:tetratricopeptide (TPR) repeat protein
MKKLVLFLAAMAVVSIAQAQVVRYNPEQLKKKAAASDVNIQNPKKNSKVNVWLDRGDVYFGLGAGMIAGVYQGQHKQEIFTIVGKPEKIWNAILGDKEYEAMKFKYFTLFLQDEKIATWSIDVMYDEKALDKSAEAYAKAYQLEEKVEPRVKEGLSKIVSYYLNVAQVICVPQNNLKGAAQAFAKAYEVSKMSPLNHIDTLSAYNAGYISVIEKDYETAAKYLPQVEQLGYHKDGEVYYYLYFVFKELKQDQKAEEYMKKGAAMYPNNKNLTELLINSYMTSDRDINEILAEIDHAIKNDPNNAAYYFYKAMLLEKKGMLNEALEMFLKVLEFQPDEYNSNFNTGVIYTRLAEQVREELNQISYREKEKYDATMKKMDDLYFESLKYYEKAYVADPNSLDVMEILKSTYFYFREKKEGMMDKYNQIKAKIDNMSERLQSM